MPQAGTSILGLAQNDGKREIMGVGKHSLMGMVSPNGSLARPRTKVRGQSPQRRLVDDPWEGSTLQPGVSGCEHAAIVLIADGMEICSSTLRPYSEIALSGVASPSPATATPHLEPQPPRCGLVQTTAWSPWLQLGIFRASDSDTGPFRAIGVFPSLRRWRVRRQECR
jgi:hypothetical protein